MQTTEGNNVSDNLRRYSVRYRYATVEGLPKDRRTRNVVVSRQDDNNLQIRRILSVADFADAELAGLIHIDSKARL